MVNEITYEQLEAYCKKRDLVIITSEVFYKMKPAWTWVKDPTQAFIEQRRAYEAKISKQSHEIEMLNATVIELTKCATRARVKYDNIRSLLNRYIASGLMPGYFDIYNDLQDTKHKLKDARKEAAKANKKYKQLKKEFSRYRNEHTDSDCNCHIQQLKRDIDLYKSQIAQLELNFEEYKKEHPEKAVEFKCEECASSYKDTTSDGVDIMYCCESMVDGKCECDSGCVSDVRACPGFKPKEGQDEERAVSVCSDPQATGNG